MSAKVQNRIHKLAFVLFLLLVFSLGFMKPTVELGPAALTPTDLIFPFSLLCWLGAIAMGEGRPKWQSAYWAFLLYFAASLISSILSVNLSLSLVKLSGVLYLLLLAVSAASLVTSLDRLRLCVLVWLAGAFFPLLVAFAAVFIFYTAPETGFLADITYHHGAVPIGNFPRVSSTFISASMFCNYLTVAVMLALISERMGWIRDRVAFALITSAALAAAFTVSIALGGLFLAVGLWMWFAASGRVITTLGLVSGITTAVAFLAIAPFDLSRPFAPSSRLLVWRHAWNTFITHPIFGKGLGTGAASVAYQNSDGRWSLLTDAHNMFLNVAAESGIVGVAALLAVIVAMLKSAFSSTEAGVELKLVRVGLGIAFVSTLVYDGMTGSFEDARHLWVLIGLILAAERISES